MLKCLQEQEDNASTKYEAKCRALTFSVLGLSPTYQINKPDTALVHVAVFFMRSEAKYSCM